MSTEVRRLLKDLEREEELRANPLLAEFRDESHERLRARILRAVEALDPGPSSTPAAQRRARMHYIVVHCDLHGQSHKEAASALGLSRRQFYRDRQQAFSALASELQRSVSPALTEAPHDMLTMQLDYIQLLREQGRNELVWRESMRVLREMRGHPREVEVWTVASEAARLLGNVDQARTTIDAMRRVSAESPHADLRRACALRIAIIEMALESMVGNTAKALRVFEYAVKTSGAEERMYGRDATLFVILLEMGAQIYAECGNWTRAEEFVQRAQRIGDRSLLPWAKARQQRFRGQIALERDGDVRRSLVELRDALAGFQSHKVFSGIAACLIDYGTALTHLDRREGCRYIDQGLSIARSVCGYDEFAVLLAGVAPVMSQCIGTQDVLASIEAARERARLSTRAELYVRMAEAEVYLQMHDYETAERQARDLSESFENAQLLPAAARARVVTAECMAYNGKPMRARVLLKRSAELLREHAVASTYERAARIAAIRETNR